MKFAFKSLIAAAAFLAAHAASAATVTVTVGNTVYKGVKLSGSETLTFSQDALWVFDTYLANLTAVGAGVVSANKDSDGYYTNASLTTPITTLNVDDATDQALSVASAGGLTMTVPMRKSISSGGTLTVTDLNVDLANKKVYATLVGTNGTGTLTHFPLWDIGNPGESVKVIPAAGGSGATTFTVSGLGLTTEGYNQTVTALALGSLGKAALRGVPDFGTISFSLQAVSALPICAVTFKTQNKNQALFDTEVTITNNSSNPTTGWKLNWNYSKPTLLINVKNAKLTDKNLKQYTAQPVKANTTITAGGATTFSFRGHANGGAPTVSDLSATVGGQTCLVTAP